LVGIFEHTVQNADFIDCFLLPTKTVVVKVGRRNLLTGGLVDEELFSFRYDTNFLPHTLTEEESVYLEVLFDHEHESLTGWNNLETGSSWVIYKTMEKQTNKYKFIFFSFYRFCSFYRFSSFYKIFS
jgi:hypothetical protein